LKNFTGAEEIETVDPQFFMRRKCHIFAPCCTYGTLNKFNAHHLKTKIVIEVANGPTTFSADEILLRKGIHIIPDMLANIGGMSVGYLEWLQNLDHVSPGRMTRKLREQQKNQILQKLGYKIPENSPLMKALKEGSKDIEIVHSCVEEFTANAVKETWALAQKKNISLRDAAISNSIKMINDRF